MAFLHPISRMNGWILTKLVQLYCWDRDKNWLDFGELDSIFKATLMLRFCKMAPIDHTHAKQNPQIIDTTFFNNRSAQTGGGHMFFSENTVLIIQLILKILSGMANSVGTDHTAPTGAVWSGSSLFACHFLLYTYEKYHCLLSNLRHKKFNFLYHASSFLILYHYPCLHRYPGFAMTLPKPILCNWTITSATNEVSIRRVMFWHTMSKIMIKNER